MEKFQIYTLWTIDIPNLRPFILPELNNQAWYANITSVIVLSMKSFLAKWVPDVLLNVKRGVHLVGRIMQNDIKNGNPDLSIMAFQWVLQPFPGANADQY